MKQGWLGLEDRVVIVTGGASGIGKSSAISRAITLITENRIIEVEESTLRIH